MTEEQASSVGSDEIPPIVDVEVNPEGYGIEGEFVPVAVFEVIEEKPTTEENLFENLAVAESPSYEAKGKKEKREEGVEMVEQGVGKGLPAVEGEETMEEAEGEEKGEGEEEAEGEDTVKEESEDEASEEEEKTRPEKEEEGEEEKVGPEGQEEKSETGEEEGRGEAVEKAEEEAAEKAEGKPSEEHKAKGEVKFGEDGEEGEKKKTKKEVFKRRLSIRKKSIFYAAESRFRTGEERRVSGDFNVIQEDVLGSVKSPPSIASFQAESGEYSYEEEVEEEEVPPINREYYYDHYKALSPERRAERMKNNFLHRKMADYFKKRKMEHVLKETDQQVDSQHKYDKKLDALADLRDLDTRERNSITAELNDMRSQRDDQQSMLDVHFNAMQNREKEIGTGLINTKTGKEIPDKIVERLLKRQRDKWTEVAEMRLNYIKIRDRVTEKKAALHALDCIGDNLHLIDYEQLKIENQSHTDKIEERDEELTKLRVKCQGAMQCLAHVREKSAAVLLDINQLTERYEEVEMEYMECRERLNYFKQERDYYRIETDKLCEEIGLLNKPKLLQDMEDSMEEVKIKSQQLVDLKEENARLKASLKAIKKNIVNAPAKVHTIKPASVRFKSTSRRIYKGRPTLVYPQLPRSNWSDSTDLS